MSKRDVLRILNGDFLHARRMLQYPKVEKEEVQAYHDAVEVHATFVEQCTQGPQAKLDKLRVKKEKLNTQIDTAASELADAIQQASAAFTKQTPIIAVKPEYFLETHRRSRKVIDYITIDGVPYEQAHSIILSDKTQANRDKDEQLKAQYNQIERTIYLDGVTPALKSLITQFTAFIKELND